MADVRKSSVLRQIRTVFDAGSIAGLTDGQLLERFTNRDREAAELAFEALVERHGSMVLNVCRGILRNHHDAQDAFQATFLVLVSKARTLWVRDSLSPWLHDVAYRVACHARSSRSHRRRHERRASGMAVGMINPASHDDHGPALHEEIHHLPERYRVLIALCDLGGLTHEQAARELGLPVGTVKSRLARGRGRLRSRLIRRGLVPSAGILASALPADAASVSVPPGLMDSTLRAALNLATGKTAAGSVASAVVALTEGALRTMFLIKLKTAVGLLLVVGLSASGGLALAFQGSGRNPGDSPAASKRLAEDTKRDTDSPPEQPSPSAENLSERLRVELDLMQAQLEAKKAELRREEAQRELALSALAIAQRLNARHVGMISEEELKKTESEVKIATAQVDIVKSELKEMELRLDQLKSTLGHPERMKDYLDRVGTSGSSASLERRLRGVEQKLERILEVLDTSKRQKPAGDSPPPKR